MKTFDKMLFGYMVLKGEESPLTFRIPKNLYQYTRHIRKLEAVVQKTRNKNIPGTDAVVSTEAHLPQHTAQRTQPADPESCGLETPHDAAGRGIHETHSGITKRSKTFKLRTEQNRAEHQLNRDMNLYR